MFLEQNLKFEIECKQVSKRSSYLRLQSLLTFFQVRYPTCRLLQHLVSLVQGVLEIGATLRFFHDRTVDNFHFGLAASKSTPGTVTGSPLPANKRLLLFLVSQPTCAESCLGFDSVARSPACTKPRRPRVTLHDRSWKSPEKRQQAEEGDGEETLTQCFTSTRFIAFPRVVFPYTQEQPVFKLAFG